VVCKEANFHVYIAAMRGLDDEPKGLLQKQDIFSKEQEREDHTELVEKVQSQSKQLAELEREGVSN